MYYLFCAIRQERLVYETLYSIAALFQVINSENSYIVVYTDQIKHFENVFNKTDYSYKSSIHLEYISPEIVSDWMSRGYPHRVKIHAMQEFIKKYDSNVLFIDSDMYPIKTISSLVEHIENNDFVLFLKSQSLYREISIFREKLDERVIFKSKKIIFKDRFIANANHFRHLSGIIGMNKKYYKILERVFLIADTLFEYTGFISSEETAFSLVFQENGIIHNAYNEFNHYSHRHPVRYLVAFSLDLFLNNDKQHLQEYLSFFKLDISFLERIQMKYHEIKLFIYLFEQYFQNKDLSKNIITINALQDNIIKNTKSDKEQFYECLTRFVQNL